MQRSALQMSKPPCSAYTVYAVFQITTNLHQILPDGVEEILQKY